VEGQARVLQQRVEVLAVRRRRPDPLERVRGEQGKQQEADADQALDGEHPGAQPRRQIASEQRHRRAEQRQDQDPQQQRSLVVAPHARHLVEHGFQRVRILHHVGDREIRGHEGVHQRQEGDQHEQQLGASGGLRQLHPGGIAARRAGQRQGALHQRGQQRQDQRKMPDLDNHFASLLCQRPDFLSASATSGGM
jgi:hypothetical protein